jgi:tellurite methyltransferase
MPLEDAQRWNERYLEESRYKSFTKPRPFLVQNLARLPKKGLALDVAMGLGGNAELLLQHGLDVIGVDISNVALRQAKQRLPNLMAVRADLTRFFIPPHTFDVILNFFYLQRDLWPAYLAGLNPGGWLVIETLTRDMRDRLTDIDPKYLLAPGELRKAFPTLETQRYFEGWTESDSGHPRAVACLLARKPYGNRHAS